MVHSAVSRHNQTGVSSYNDDSYNIGGRTLTTRMSNFWGAERLKDAVGFMARMTIAVK